MVTLTRTGWGSDNPAYRQMFTGLYIPDGGSFELGPFQLSLVTLTHSIPEPNGLAIKTPLGTVFHTGDWKLDPSPVIGKPTDIEAIKAQLGVDPAEKPATAGKTAATGSSEENQP